MNEKNIPFHTEKSLNKFEIFGEFTQQDNYANVKFINGNDATHNLQNVFVFSSFFSKMALVVFVAAEYLFKLNRNYDASQQWL